MIPPFILFNRSLYAFPRQAAGLLALCVLPVLQAGQYGSASPFSFTGTYTLPGTVTTTALPNGNTLDKATWEVVRVSSADVLREMEARGLFRYGIFESDWAHADDFRLVLVAKAHHGDGVAFFATSDKFGPVAVPADLLTFDTNDGPLKGTAVVTGAADLVSLKRSTHNLATFTRPGLVAKGAVRQTWTLRLKGDPYLVHADGHRDAEAVELASGTGRVTGPVTLGDKTGVAELSLRIGKPRVVDLTPYGMASEDPSTGFPTGSTSGVNRTGLIIGYEGDARVDEASPGTIAIFEVANGRLTAVAGNSAPMAEVSLIVERSTPESPRYVAVTSSGAIDLSPYVGGTITLLGDGLDDLPDLTILDAQGHVAPIPTAAAAP